MSRYEYYINLDERGEFRADVRRDGHTVFEFEGPDIFEAGFMRHKSDVAGLEEYLKDLGVMASGDTLVAAN